MPKRRNLPVTKVTKFTILELQKRYCVSIAAILVKILQKSEFASTSVVGGLETSSTKISVARCSGQRDRNDVPNTKFYDFEHKFDDFDANFVKFDAF